ncbi:MAG: sigma factor-like helix-turn-helix DNA-binding protein [Anaerostipes sp.]|nr:sigma factor-like helix-turn-helix DNA-binding protein [Hespellia stercorisuis]MDD3186290.1 sigma factor-like helix-turn-helix DNA-binding protein [Anaerostipes sp.]MDD3746300.1 sigma factor-like helix-turn-helix DNA-binding protein [Anaerostipes sp.]
MMTLKELRTMVGSVDKEMRVPSVRKLTESRVPVVVKEKLDQKAELTVFANGYVLYRIDNRVTVFPIPECQSYCYEDVSGAGETISSDFFENENWYVRLILEGEDRLKENQRIRQNTREVSYSIVSEDWAVLGTEANRALDHLIEMETIQDILKNMDERQRYAFMRYHIDCATQKEIANELDIPRTTLTDILRKTMKMVREEMGVERVDIEVSFKRNRK